MLAAFALRTARRQPAPSVPPAETLGSFSSLDIQRRRIVAAWAITDAAGGDFKCGEAQAAPATFVALFLASGSFFLDQSDGFGTARIQRCV